MSASNDAGRKVSARITAGSISLLVGIALLGAKYAAYRLTHSTAILSDAMESIVNVTAALFALGGLLFASRAADRSHPYGHGKVEFFTAAFEGGLIAFAAVMIVYEAVDTLLEGTELQALDVGVAITAVAGILNAALGAYLVRTGRRTHSPALIADGQHVLSDFWTSLGVVAGLLLVRATGITWIDPVVAALVAVNLAWTGLRLVRGAAGGLLDAEDTVLLRELIGALNASLFPGIIRVHNLKAIRAGRFSHVDAHLVVPEFWSVHAAHDAAAEFERRVLDNISVAGEIAFHTDPCRRAHCMQCEVADCSVRTDAFRTRPALTLEEAREPDPPAD